MSRNKQDEPLLVPDSMYYVYGLIDPRNREVFYVGKGLGKRMYQHVNEVKNGFICNEKKSARIKEILESGVEVEYSVFATFESERLALDYERLKIGEHDNLTNIMDCGVRQSQEERKEIIRRWAEDMLNRIMPFDEWCEKRKPTETGKKSYHCLVAELHLIAVNPLRCARKLIISESGQRTLLV